MSTGEWDGSSTFRRKWSDVGAVGSRKFGLFAREFFASVRDPLRRNVVAGKLGIQQGQPQLLTGRRNGREMKETRISIFWRKIDHCLWNTNMLANLSPPRWQLTHMYT
ncbi:hypothetical protein Adt_30794 [Abeliophyllum distichum]|uniref:Uncharacterized protein n=1 Tax=Abeliophyllum distichum TaxID=126358 RepID=A0ABD1RE11_9LAMI